MTTLGINISHKDRLDSAIDELIDLNGKKDRFGVNYELSLQDIDRDELLNLCRLVIECNNRDFGNTFCNDDLVDNQSLLLDYMHINKFETKEESKNKFFEKLEDAFIQENECYLEELIKERCEEKMRNEEIDSGRYREPEYEWSPIYG